MVNRNITDSTSPFAIIRVKFVNGEKAKNRKSVRCRYQGTQLLYDKIKGAVTATITSSKFQMGS